MFVCNLIYANGKDIKFTSNDKSYLTTCKKTIFYMSNLK